MGPRLPSNPFAASQLRGDRPTDFWLVLDESGVPGTDPEFVTGGLLAFGTIADLEMRATTFLNEHSIGRAKGAKLDERQLLAVSGFLSTYDAIPVAVHSVLADDTRELARDASRRYAALDSGQKTTARIAPASWIWKSQMNFTIALAHVAAITRIGPIGRLAVRIDRFSDSKDMQAHYRRLLEERLGLRGRGDTASGIPRDVTDFFAAASGTEPGSLDLKATGPLAVLADFVCAIYRMHRQRRTEAWQKLVRPYLVQPHPAPACMGADATDEVATFIRLNAAAMREEFPRSPADRT